MRAIVLAALAATGCRRPAAPPPPDAQQEIELVPPGEIKQKVNDTLEKEHERTLRPVVE